MADTTVVVAGNSGFTITLSELATQVAQKLSKNSSNIITSVNSQQSTGGNNASFNGEVFRLSPRNATSNVTVGVGGSSNTG